MGIFDSIFGGGDDIADAASDAAWGGSQSINYAVNAGQGLLMDAANKSSGYLTDAEQKGQNYLQKGYDRATGFIMPWNTAGKDALSVYAGLLGIPGYETTYSPESYLRKTPGYLWQLGQGQNALDASAAGRGMLLSGPQRQASQTYGQNYASNYYDKLMNQLSGLSTTGLQAGGTLGNWSTELGRNQANLGMMSAKDLANIENALATQRTGLLFKGAEGTVNAYDKELQGMMAGGSADQGSLSNILGLVGTLGGIATAPTTGGSGSGGGYTPTWNNTLSQFNSSSYGRGW